MKAARRSHFLVILCLAVSLTAAAVEDGYVVHTVKWFEDLNSISARYGVPSDVIMSVNNLTDSKLSTRQQLLIPTDRKLWEKQRQEEGLPEEAALPPAVNDTLPCPTSRVRMGLVLPFSCAGEVQRTNSLDFYSGVLMAIRQMGGEGIDVELDVRDFSLGAQALEGLDSIDFILGPIRSEDIVETSTLIGDKIIISPLDQRVESLVGSNVNLIQAPSRSTFHFARALKWAEEIYRNDGRETSPNYILVSSHFDPETDREARACLDAGNIGYKVCNCSVQGELEGWEEAYNPSALNIVILGISNEAALNNAVRNMSIEVTRENVMTFAGSKVLAYSSIPLENIHRAGIHAVCSYFVDYSDPRTQEFIGLYREMFRTSPSQFAFQGYDLALYTLRTFADYGAAAWRHLVKKQAGQTDLLQTSIKLTGLEDGGLVNDGVRCVEFKQDYSTILVK